MRSPQALARRQLDERLGGLGDRIGVRPARGWLRSIREALGMSTMEMAQRMGVTHSRISQIERAEVEDSIRLGTLRRAAESLGCELHYVLVPVNSLEETVQLQAMRKARALVNATTHTMRIEKQEPEPAIVGEQLDELAESLVDTRRLWRDD